MWILKSAGEAPEPITFRILPGNIKTIGRSPGAQFIVDAALVSRLHCRVSAGATELQVDDLDSTNGTFVNGKRVKRSSLKEGDRLGVGRVELVISREPRNNTDNTE
jgi:pSer/pThr/pTyr-binding forkhead associated (FHA) protein